MDIITHELWAIMLFGYRRYTLYIGTIFADFPYLIAFLFSNGYIGMIGQRLHSIFIILILLIILIYMYFKKIKGYEKFKYFSYGYIAHIIIDLLTHTCDGSRYLYPISDKIYKTGIFCWHDYIFIIFNVLILLLIFLFLRIKYKWNFKENILKVKKLS